MLQGNAAWAVALVALAVLQFTLIFTHDPWLDEYQAIQLAVQAPDVPTMLELGWDVVFEDWSGVVAPARTPAAIVERANAAISEIVRSPAGIAAMEKLSVEADANSVSAFAKIYRETWERYQAVVKETGFKAED